MLCLTLPTISAPSFPNALENTPETLGPYRFTPALAPTLLDSAGKLLGGCHKDERWWTERHQETQAKASNVRVGDPVHTQSRSTVALPDSSGLKPVKVLSYGVPPAWHKQPAGSFHLPGFL